MKIVDTCVCKTKALALSVKDRWVCMNNNIIILLCDRMALDKQISTLYLYYCLHVFSRFDFVVIVGAVIATLIESVSGAGRLSVYNFLLLYFQYSL